MAQTTRADASFGPVFVVVTLRTLLVPLKHVPMAQTTCLASFGPFLTWRRARVLLMLLGTAGVFVSRRIRRWMQREGWREVVVVVMVRVIIVLLRLLINNC